ncbi:hypothetical protein [Mesorhizobium sp. B2-8-9]|uniref:hypothetical protein n=1 Tax=Mesorhizobium sp. B2-8-9 TaxID=2589899 RepID=UPI00112E3995|nr:hypothetical protein [Mesorhizobium sp. B2-8-9]TPI86490.1 hypothetical protein FJ423_01320 [Mesorhizobium sp. B2-8-9]
MNASDLDDRFDYIKRAYSQSEERIAKLNALNDAYAGTGVFLVVNGSLARKETVDGSDFDAFVVQKSGSTAAAKELWQAAHDAAGLKKPGSTGIFGENSVSNYEDTLYNIGGSSDSNEKITQRMLLILESMPIGDINSYFGLVHSMLRRYISDLITDHQLSLFLLNDIIRYYRTICVDFEFKTEEDNKPWGIRNIKLVFSRKLIYFSGLLICAETAQRSAIQKREICYNLIKKTPIERMLLVLREDAFEPLTYYSEFLKNMANKEVREHLEGRDKEEVRRSELFRSLKNDGHHFSMSLRSAFVRHYDSSHPIHRAIMF